MEKNVNESSITRLMRHNEEHDCVCMTAYRSNREKDDSGVHKRKARVSNQKANAALGAVLRRYGYNVTKVVGKYPEEDGQADVKENSWFVVNVNDDSDFVDVCADLAEADEQDSILVMPKGSFSSGKGCYLYGTNPNGSWPKYHEKKMTDGISVNGDSPFETRISGKRYSFNVVDESKDDIFWNPSSMFGAMARHAYIKNHYGLDFFNIANETSRFQKAKKAFLGQMKNIRNFAIITPENPMGVASTSTDNSALCEKFENSLKSGHYLFYKVRGKFNGNLEHSYMVFNVQLEQVKKWACESEFNQQSFFFCESQYDEVDRKTGVKFNYWSRKPGKKNAFELIESTLEWIDFTNMDSEFTAIGRNFKFSIPLQCFMETANSKYENAKKNMKSDVFEMCFNEALSNRGFNGWASRGRIMKFMKQQKINETIDGSIKDIIQLKTLDNSLEYSQMFDALQDCPKDFQTKLIQTLNSVGETIHVSPVDVFNIVLCASNKEDDKDVVKKMYNWWRGVFEVLSKCDVPDDRKKEYDDLVDVLMAEITKTGNDVKVNEAEEYGYEQADIEDEDAMLKDMKFAISKIGEIANKVQDLINFVNPYCQSFNEDKIMKFKKINEKDDEWIDMDDLIGVPQSDPRDDIEIPKRLHKADESNVVVDVNDVWELLKVLEDDEASNNLKSLIDSHVRSEAEIMDAIDELYPENVTQIELNNVFATGMEEIVDALGLDVDAYMKDGSFVDTLKPSTIAAEGDEESNQDEVKDGEKKYKGDDGEVKTLDNADKKVVSEMTIEQEIDDPWKLSEMMWGQGQENLQELLRSDVVDEEEVMQMIEDMGIRDLTGINDVFAFEFREILESLGLDGKAWSNNLEIKRKDDDDEE